MKLVNNKKIYSKMKLESIINTNLYPLDDQDSERYKKLLDELRWIVYKRDSFLQIVSARVVHYATS